MKQKLILGLSLVIFILALVAVSQLEIVSNMEDMLPEDSIGLKSSKQFNEYFEGQDQVIIVLKEKAGTAKNENYQTNAQAFLDDLAIRLETKEYIESILYKVDTSEIMPFAWGYLDIALYDDIELAMQKQDFAKIQNMLQDIEQDLENAQDIAHEFITNDKATHYMMIVKPKLNQEDYIGSRSALYDGIHEQLSLLLSQSEYMELDAGLTGGAFIQDIEADTVAFDSLFGTMAVTLILILLVLIVFFKSLKLPLLTVYPLILGAVVAAAFAYIIYGSLNMFAVSFALLLLGLGIDFAVHLLTRYQEERNNGIEIEEATKISVKSTGGSIIFGAITTAFAFATFAFAKFKAFEQMGIISAIGLISLCIGMLVLVPAIIMVFDKKSIKGTKKQINFNWLKHVTKFNIRRPWLILVIIIVALVTLYPAVATTTIQSDITAIYPDNIPSLDWAKEVEEAFDYNIDTISFYADNQAELAEILKSLNKRDDIKSIDSIFDYIPTQIDKKLDILLKLETMLKQNGINAFDELTLELMSIEDLPQSIKDNYIGKDGKIRAEVIPAINIYEKDDYDQLAEAINKETTRYPVGMPTLFNEITELVKQDIIKICIFCFGIVFVISWIVFKKLKLALLTITPLVMTLYTTLGILPIFSIEINVFSIAAFPLIIGIGIDSSIHLIHRLNESDQLSIDQKVLRTGRAIMLTGITTIIGFGSLASINHPGMANLGLAVAVGIIMSMIYTLVIIPVGYNLLYKDKQTVTSKLKTEQCQQKS